MLLCLSTDEDFFIIIHNMDGILLRSDKSQAVLSQLARIQGFHIIASIDHINAPFCKWKVHHLQTLILYVINVLCEVFLTFFCTDLSHLLPI